MTVIEQRTMESIQSINQKIPNVQLRDLFAMNALNGLLACVNTSWVNTSWDEMDFAEKSYKFADAMLVARGR